MSRSDFRAGFFIILVVFLCWLYEGGSLKIGNDHVISCQGKAGVIK